MSFQYSAAALFTNRSTRWWDHHLEVQTADDRRHELDERLVFPMGAFGYRTRYDRILNESNHSRLNRQIRQRLAEYVVAHGIRGFVQESGGIDYRGAKALRLVRTSWPVGDRELAQPEGEWKPPPVTEVLAPKRIVLGTYNLAKGKVAEVPPRRSAPPASAQPIQPASPLPSKILRPRLPMPVRPPTAPQQGAPGNQEPGAK